MPIIVDPNTPSAAISAGDIITVAAKKLGVIGQGESLGAQEMADGLAGLNSLIDALGIDRTLLQHLTTVQYTWPANTQERTIGDGGDIDTIWPTNIEAGTFFRDSNNNDYPVTVTHNAEDYNQIRFKPVSGAFPEMMYYDKAFPLGTLKIFPYSTMTLTLYLLCWQPLESFSTPTTGVTLPPGYRRMLENNLAVDMEGVWNMPCPASVRQIAKESKADVMRANLRPQMASLQEASITSSKNYSSAASRYNILQGG